MRNFIVPILKNSEIHASGFIINFQEQALLITAGHTFQTDDDDLCVDDYYFTFNEVDYSLFDLDQWKIENQLNRINSISASLPRGINSDYGIFRLPLNDWGELPTLINTTELTRGVYTIAGYNTIENTQEEHDWRNVSFDSAANISISIGHPERGTQFVAENCRTGFGFCRRGFSGGAVIVPETINIIGMIVVGNECEYGQENYCNKRQHFITSDYLIEKINEFNRGE